MASGGLACLMFTLVALNILAAAASLALFAVAIWVVVDGYKLYAISAVSGKDDIFAAAWIAIFTGFAFFLTCLFGIFAAVKRSRRLMLVYLIVMFIIFIFECASAITAATNRDYLVGNSNLVKKQMLQYYTDDSSKGNQITDTWNRVMQEVKCCGADGPADWITFDSTYKTKFPNSFSWPPNCCEKLSNSEVKDPISCRDGGITLFKKGCFQHIEWVLSHYTWAVNWYGFAVLMLVFFMLLLAMVYYIQLD
ncbi:uroplakin-1a [Triplophysa rosa]|uniref:Tetraspanin n=1 Tax=Triplophysa rosa TaxID=992332 RepID=A0A9W8C2S7_TRIRA|nr:uroplakin-1a [Triplophysa rosa]KAI7806441.1 uroplakin-1a [Triplophysa rosa]